MGTSDDCANFFLVAGEKHAPGLLNLVQRESQY